MRTARDEVITASAKGLDEPLGQNGQRLSGGERQRLAIARALVGAPSLLVLDEATSALDTATEARLLENLKSLRATVVVVAHRPAAIRAAERALVVECGQVVGELSPSEIERFSISQGASSPQQI